MSRSPIYDSGVDRVLLILPSATYRAPDFLAAARELGVAVTVASERRAAMSAKPSGTPITPISIASRDIWKTYSQVRTFFWAWHPVDWCRLSG